MISHVAVLLVDDHPMVRAGLSNLIATTEDLKAVGEAADGLQAVTLADQLLPDVVLMDLSMPGMDGVEATRLIVDAHPEIQVVVLTSFADKARVAESLAAGAVGYLLKDCEAGEVLSAIRSASQGHAPLDARVARALLPSSSATPRVKDSLSARELEVLRLVAEGQANKQIGGSLGISERTVKVHVGNIFRRLGVADRASAALWAHDHVSAERPA
jgi:DNA-binding NarL/FixJ family response regulator